MQDVSAYDTLPMDKVKVCFSCGSDQINKTQMDKITVEVQCVGCGKHYTIRNMLQDEEPKE
jgi:hypothetical protein